jgi:hypothetical protein
MKKHLLSLVLAAGMLSACGSQGVLNVEQLAQPAPAGQAKLVITRDSNFYAFAAAVNVSLNGRRIASLGRGATVVQLAKAGENTLGVASVGDFGNYVTTFQADAGKTYTFEVSPKASILPSGALWGPIGEMVKAQQVENSGTFQVLLKDVK